MTSFRELCISCTSSDPETDPDGFESAIREAFGDLVEDLDVPYVDTSDDDDDDGYRPGNYGQYDLSVTFWFTRPITMEEFDTCMEKVDGDSFGFGNGWDVQ